MLSKHGFRQVPPNDGAQSHHIPLKASNSHHKACHLVFCESPARSSKAGGFRLGPFFHPPRLGSTKNGRRSLNRRLVSILLSPSSPSCSLNECLAREGQDNSQRRMTCFFCCSVENIAWSCRAALEKARHHSVETLVWPSQLVRTIHCLRLLPSAPTSWYLHWQAQS